VAPVFAPDLDDEVAEAVYNLCIVMKLRRALDIADGAEPPRYSVEFAELLLERGDDGKPGEAGRLISLLEGEVAADGALGQQAGSVDRWMTRDVCDPLVHVHELEVAGRVHRCGQRQLELFQPRFDPAHPGDTSRLTDRLRKGGGGSTLRLARCGEMGALDLPIGGTKAFFLQIGHFRKQRAAQESNLPSVGLPRLTGFEALLRNVHSRTEAGFRPRFSPSRCGEVRSDQYQFQYQVFDVARHAVARTCGPSTPSLSMEVSGPEGSDSSNHVKTCAARSARRSEIPADPLRATSTGFGADAAVLVMAGSRRALPPGRVDVWTLIKLAEGAMPGPA
jgi:hypothetical protein